MWPSRSVEAAGPGDASAQEPAQEKCGCRRLLWIRKVHSACGLVFAVFLVEHLAATALGWKPLLLGRYIQFIHAVLAEAPWLRILVLAPLAVAAVFGGYLLMKGWTAVQREKVQSRREATLLVATSVGGCMILFLGFHLSTLPDFRGLIRPLGPNTVSPTLAAGDTSARATLVASVAGFQATWPTDGPLYPLRFRRSDRCRGGNLGRRLPREQRFVERARSPWGFLRILPPRSSVGRGFASRLALFWRFWE